LYQCRNFLTVTEILVDLHSGECLLIGFDSKSHTVCNWRIGQCHQLQELPMKSITILIKTLVLALCLSQMAVAAGAVPQVVNINSADAATLDRVLIGIGPSKAQAIVAHRKAHGAFRSVDALGDVKGIGPATIKRNAGRISLGAKVPAKTAAKTASPTRAVSAR
jgi:competence protein ComEA